MRKIPIVIADGATNTQRGEVIIILNQYVYVGKGTSFHSSSQIEAYKNKVYDRAIKARGNKLLKLLMVTPFLSTLRMLDLV